MHLIERICAYLVILNVFMHGGGWRRLKNSRRRLAWAKIGWRRLAKPAAGEAGGGWRAERRHV